MFFWGNFIIKKEYDINSFEVSHLTNLVIELVNTNKEIQKIAQEVSPLLTDFYNDIALNSPLFERIKLVYNIRKTLSLSDEQKTQSFFTLEIALCFSYWRADKIN